MQQPGLATYIMDMQTSEIYISADPTVGNVIQGTALHCAVCYDGGEDTIVNMVKKLLQDCRMYVHITALCPQDILCLAWKTIMLTICMSPHALSVQGYLY